MNTIILGISGRKQAGKTETFKFINSRWNTGPYNSDKIVRDFSFAGPLKKMCIELLGVKPEQVDGTDDQKNSLVEHLLWENFPVVECRRVYKAAPYDDYIDHLKVGPMTAREVMQYWGTNIFRTSYHDVWAKSAVREIERVAEEIRDENGDEVSLVAILPDMRFPNEVEAVKEAGGYVLRLTRNIFPDETHPSEIVLDEPGYDWNNFDMVYDNSNMGVAAQMIGLSPWLREIGVLP